MKYTLDDIKKAVKSNGYELTISGNTVNIVDAKRYKLITNNWKQGTKLIRISEATYRFNIVTFDKWLSEYGMKIILQDGTYDSHVDSYKFIPVSWVTPKKSHLPDWL